MRGLGVVEFRDSVITMLKKVVSDRFTVPPFHYPPYISGLSM